MPMDQILADRVRRARSRAGDSKTAATHAFGIVYAAELGEYTETHMRANFSGPDMPASMWGEVYKCVRAVQYMRRTLRARLFD